VLRVTRSPSWAVHWANTALIQSLLVPAWMLGGLLAACFPWISICVAAAIFAGGPRAGLVWTAIGAASAIGLLTAHATGSLPEPVVPPEIIWGLAASAHIGLFAVVWAVGSAANAVDERARLELELARAEADHANHAKSAFLARMSHELRTPMNAVIGYAELMLEEPESAHPDDLNRVRDAGLYLLGLVNDVLDLSKIDAGQMVFTREEVDLAELSRGVVEAASPLFARGHNRVELDLHDDIRAIADPLRVRQCLFNLLSNAARFTRHGLIRVGARRVGARVELAVTDTGPGVPPEQQAKIFEPFVQATDAIQRTHGGTGLGLAIVRQLAEAMGGGVSLSSEVVVGSTFTITLPASERTASAPAR